MNARDGRGAVDALDAVGAVDAAAERAEVEALLRERAIEPVFQPILELAGGEIVGYEALARGPEDGSLHFPDRLFGVARRVGLLEEVDLLARRRALESAVAAGLTGPMALFVNVEPGAVGREPPIPSPALGCLGERGVTPVVEITERALTDDPAGLLAYADWIHEAGWHVALDDVGANPDSLALMPFLRPEVVKLDLRLVQERPDEAVAETMTAVTAYAERTGAAIVAEGVETAAHERMARSLGADLVQGYRYARPGPLRPAAAPARPLVLAHPGLPTPVLSPYAAVTAERTPQRATKSLLVAVSKLLERQARELGRLAVVLSAFEDARHVTASTVRRYRELAESAAFVVALGAGVPREPMPGVRGAALEPGDPVTGEWDVVVVGPHFAAALVAQDLYEDRPDPDRAFDYVLTYDRDVVLDVARALMSRALPRAERPLTIPVPDAG